MNITALKVYSTRLVLRRKYGKPRSSVSMLGHIEDGPFAFPRISMSLTWDSESNTILAMESIRSTIFTGLPLFLVRRIM
jgi:hypothetical protein